MHILALPDHRLDGRTSGRTAGLGGGAFSLTLTHSGEALRFGAEYITNFVVFLCKKVTFLIIYNESSPRERYLEQRSFEQFDAVDFCDSSSNEIRGNDCLYNSNRGKRERQGVMKNKSARARNKKDDVYYMYFLFI